MNPAALEIGRYPMMETAWLRRLFGWGIALVLHGLVFWIGLTSEQYSTPRTMTDYVPVDVVEVAPEPVAAVEPAPAPQPKATQKIDKPVDLTKTPPEAQTPPPTESADNAASEAKPVFGLGRQSFGSKGSFTMQRGNTVGIRPEDSADTDAVAALKPVATYQVSRLPRIRTQPEPNYPPALRSAGVEGDVVLELLIDAEGHVAQATVVESSNPDFEQAALEAADKLRFEPAMQGETAVAVKIRFPVKFRLR